MHARVRALTCTHAHMNPCAHALAHVCTHVQTHIGTRPLTVERRALRVRPASLRDSFVAIWAQSNISIARGSSSDPNPGGPTQAQGRRPLRFLSARGRPRSAAHGFGFRPGTVGRGPMAGASRGALAGWAGAAQGATRRIDGVACGATRAMGTTWRCVCGATQPQARHCADVGPKGRPLRRQEAGA